MIFLWINGILFMLLLVFRNLSVVAGLRSAKYILTPMVTLSIIIMAFHAPDTSSPLYHMVITGLLLSLIADVLLMLEEHSYFPYGLLFFLLAHISYLVGFSIGITISAVAVVSTMIIVATGGLFFFLLKGKTGGLDLPVLIYILALTLMTSMAVTSSIKGINSWLLATGALLFMASDGLLAVNAFIKPIPRASALVWSLYGPGQFCIALALYY